MNKEVNIYLFLCPRSPFGNSALPPERHLKLNELTVVDPEFPRRAAPTPNFGVKTYYLARFLPKTALKWKKLDREGDASLAHPTAPPADPPMNLYVHPLIKIKEDFR